MTLVPAIFKKLRAASGKIRHRLPRARPSSAAPSAEPISADQNPRKREGAGTRKQVPASPAGYRGGDPASWLARILTRTRLPLGAAACSMRHSPTITVQS